MEPTPSPQMRLRSGRNAGTTAGNPADEHLEHEETTFIAPANKHARFDSRSVHVPSGILTQLSSNYTGPIPNHENVFRIVNLIEINAISNTTYNEMISNMFPDADANTANVISQDDFLLVNKYLFKSRIDTVYSRTSGRRPSHRVPIAPDYQMPKAIADCINVYGTHLIQSGSILVIPQPAPAGEDATQRIDNLVTYARLQSYQTFVNQCVRRNFINTSAISSSSEGTGAWLLTARHTVDRSVVSTNDSRNTTVWAQFNEWTPADGIIAAILVNNYNGHIVFDHDDFLFSMNSIVDTVRARSQFATFA